MNSSPGQASRPPVRLGYLVSHPIQYQAPLLRRIAREPDIDLTVLFGSDFSVRSYKDPGFGVHVSWDTPLLEGYRSEFLRPLKFLGKSYDHGASALSPISRGLFHRLRRHNGSTPAFDALWVHGYDSANALQSIAAANILGIPVLLRAESWLGDRSRSFSTLASKNAFLAMLRNCVAAVLPIGSLNAAYWSHYLGAVPQFLMPYAVDNEYFARLAENAAPEEHALRDELQLAAGRPVILFASKLQARKHADHLVEAYQRLLSRSASAGSSGTSMPYLVIVGDGEERAALESRCRELGLTDVRFAGFRNQSELPRFFALADVFVLPSSHEPWGLVVNEAMAAGCPVIVSTDVGSHVDLITHGVEGCVFPVGDIAALTAALQRVFRTPETARLMGEAARRRMTTWSFEQDIEGLRQALAYTTRKIRA